MKKYLFLILLINFLSPQIIFAQSSSCLSTDPLDLTFHTSDQIDSRISQSNFSNGLNFYNDRPLTIGASWTRNQNSWTLKGVPLDFTGVMGWNDDPAHHNSDSYKGGAVLITPRHFITATHYGFINGTTFNFFDRNGKVFSKKIVNSINIPNTDINVGLLEGDIDSSIAHYPLINSAMLDQMIYSQKFDLPIVVFNQNGQALIRSMNSETPTNFSHNLYTSGSRANFSSSMIFGDSGQPAFMIINNQPVLIFTNYSSDVGPNLGNYIYEINSAINSLGSNNSYQLTEYDASSFKKYSSKCFVTVSKPIIDYIFPSSATVGEEVTLNGSGFTATENVIYLQNNSSTQTIGGIASTNGTSLKLTIPSWASSSYNISVENGNLDQSNKVSFSVTTPVVALLPPPVPIISSSPSPTPKIVPEQPSTQITQPTVVIIPAPPAPQTFSPQSAVSPSIPTTLPPTTLPQASIPNVIPSQPKVKIVVTSKNKSQDTTISNIPIMSTTTDKLKSLPFIILDIIKEFFRMVLDGIKNLI